MAKDGDIIRWITCGGRRIPIKKGMEGKFKKKLEEEKSKKSNTNNEKDNKEDNSKKSKKDATDVLVFDREKELNKKIGSTEDRENLQEKANKVVKNISSSKSEKDNKEPKEYHSKTGYAYDVGHYSSEQMKKNYTISHKTKDGLEVGSDDSKPEGVNNRKSPKIYYNMDTDKEDNLTEKEKKLLKVITKNNEKVEELTNKTTEIYNTKSSRKDWYEQHSGEKGKHTHEPGTKEDYYKTLSDVDKAKIDLYTKKIERYRKDSLEKADKLKEISLSERQQKYIEQGYSKETARRYAMDDMNGGTRELYVGSKNNESLFYKKRPKEFINTLKEAKESQPRYKKWRVDDYSHTEKDYDKMKTYTTDRGSTIAITKDGDIVSVCSKKGKKKDSGRALMEYAIKKGGKKLDSYDGNYEFYTKMGFEPVSWVKFDKKYAPKDWRPGIDKQEPIIFFKYTGNKNIFTKDEFYSKIEASSDYETAMRIRDNQLRKKGGKKK